MKILQHDIVTLILLVNLTLLFFPLFSLADDHGSKAEAIPQVVMETSLGDIVIEFMPDKAPETVANFLQYVDDGFYNGTIFHRVIPGFVVQGGGFTVDFKRKQTREPIANESANGVKNVVGTLSMARTRDPDSATSQFFINLVDNSNLDFVPGRPGYAVFAKVIEGMDVVKSIASQPRGKYRGVFQDAPNESVIINKAYRR